MKTTQYTIHNADSRGGANHGWLKARHTFSFASYYDPERIHFGALRVLNDDIIAPAMGFSTHPHDNMEIITIALEGSLAHKDDMGNSSIIKPGEVQIMSAGSGVKHSEANASSKEQANILQIWVFPKLRNINPRYDQKFYAKEDRQNQWQVVVSPRHPEALWINQDAYFSLIDISDNFQVGYDFLSENSGVYIFVIDGKISLDNVHHLNRRDGAGIENTNKITITAHEKSFVLAMEVPLIF